MKFLTKKNGYIAGWITILLVSACWYVKAKIERRDEQHRAYLQAISLEAYGQLEAARVIYTSLCDIDFYQVPENREGTCTAVERLDKVIATALAETMAALEAYKKEHGAYPDGLFEISGRLNGAARVLINTWMYCKKTDLNAKGGNCDDGSEYVSWRPVMLINREFLRRR